MTTMASSTTKPTEMVNASSETLSTLNPASHIITTVPASDSGTEIIAAKVGTSRRRNRNTTSVTSEMLAASVSWRSSMLLRMLTVWSDMVATVTSGGISRWMSGMAARMASTVLTTLPSAVLLTMRMTAGSWLNQPALRRLSRLSSIRATSPSRTTVPPWFFSTIEA